MAILLALSMATASGAATKRGTSKMGFVLENEYAKWAVGADGVNLHLIDRSTGKDYVDKRSGAFAQVKKSGKVYNCSSVSSDSGRISLSFGSADVHAVLKAESKKSYFVITVESLTGEGIEEMTFGNAKLTLKGDPSEPFACCSMALNLKTRVIEIPGINNHLQAICYPRFGFAGAQVAVVACPTSKMRTIMQQVVTDAPELPKSKLGGPWALDAELPRGSYLFNFGGLSESNVDEWINLAKSLGINEIEFHGGNSFRFGDCRPNPDTYPHGNASFKAVIDRLHAAGIKAGLHTYAFLMDKSCPYVTPKPDPRLAKDATFTLAQDMSKDESTVTVTETPKDMPEVSGWLSTSSMTVQIDNELINYGGIDKNPPYAFTKCTRGAFGTTIAAHAKGAKVYHLKERFGLFGPDGDSTLLTELAQKSADFYNQCGFDAIYLDALDGQDILGGKENGWHYGALFAWELFKRLDHPAMMEMACFHHHLWYIRSRVGAMDYPTRAQKRLIDLHCAGIPGHVHAVGNRNAQRMFLPAELGWWAVHTAGNIQVERTFTDDIEYLMCKGLATNTGFALIGIDPQTIKDIPAFTRLAPIFRNYEDLRHAHYFPQSVCKQLDKPGAEFTLDKDAAGKWQLYPIEYVKHKVTSVDNPDAKWTVNNTMGEQPAAIRIEALMSVATYDSPDAKVIADFSEPEEFADRSSEKDVNVALSASSDQIKTGKASGLFTATSMRTDPKDSWADVAKSFDAPIDISAKQGLGIWVYGDGSGALLNIQITSPRHIATGIGDHFIDLNFKGWRYFELVEPDSGRVQDYKWPYIEEIYDVYREQVNYGKIGKLAIYYNNLPKGKKVECYLSQIKALPLVEASLKNPSVTINGQTIIFPVELKSWSYIEYKSPSDCKVYGPKGEVLAEITPQGCAPILKTGENSVQFSCESASGLNDRANVTVIARSRRPLR